MEFQWNFTRIKWIPLESSGIPLESSGISSEFSGISTDPVEFPLESSGNSSGITLFQWKKVPFISGIPVEFHQNSSRFQWNSTDFFSRDRRL